MKNKFVYLPVILILFSVNIFAQKQSAAAFVGAFYKFHQTRSGIFNAREVGLYKRWFSADLNKLLQNELRREKAFLKQNPTDKPHFGDGFPFQALEECARGGKSVKNVLKIGTTSTNGNRTLVEIKFYNPKACGGDFIDAYKVELVKSKGAWLINDWIYSDGTTLKQDLKRTEY